MTACVRWLPQKALLLVDVKDLKIKGTIKVE